MANESKQLHSNRRPKIVGVSHAGLFVRDMGRAVAFYRDFLGFEEQFDLTEPGGKLLLKFVKVNDRQFIELFPERDPSADRLYQVAFIVEDIEAMRSWLGEHGVVVPQAAAKGRIGNLNFTVKDPDGHILEFVQYMPDGWILQDTGKHLGNGRVSSRLKHLGFTVRHLEPSLAFYRDVLGCTVTWMGSSDGERLSWVNMKLPDSDEYVELMLTYGDISRQTRGVLDHLCLEIDDISAPLEQLKARASKGLYDRPLDTKTGLNLKRQLNLYDPDETRTEIMESSTVDGTAPTWFKPRA